MTTEEIVALIKARGVDCLLKRLTYREREVIRLRSHSAGESSR
jgi:hypothetical protein